MKWTSRSSTGSLITNALSFFSGEDEVDGEDVISGYLFGSTIVPFSGRLSLLLLYIMNFFQLIGFDS